MTLSKGNLVLLALLLLLSACSKGERANAMEAELKSKIKKAFPNGGSRAEVEAFIDKLEIASAKPTRQPFITDISNLDHNQELPSKPWKNLNLVKGFVVANFGRVGSDARTMTNMHLHAAFFFDEQDRLIEYQTYQSFHD